MHPTATISPNRPFTTGIARRAGVLALSAAAALGAMAAPAAAASTAATPVVHFATGWTEWTEGTLEAGKPVVIDYDMARLPTCRSQYAGGDAWSIGVYYRVDGGPVTSQPVTRLDENRHNVKRAAVLDLPAGARELELWFHAGDRTGCSEYDSEYGANYVYSVA